MVTARRIYCQGAGEPFLPDLRRSLENSLSSLSSLQGNHSRHWNLQPSSAHPGSLRSTESPAFAFDGEPPAAGDVAIGSGTEYGPGTKVKNDSASRSRSAASASSTASGSATASPGKLVLLEPYVESKGCPLVS